MLMLKSQQYSVTFDNYDRYFCVSLILAATVSLPSLLNASLTVLQMSAPGSRLLL